MSFSTKLAVTSNLPVLGLLNPYSYQVKPKTNRDPIVVNFDGADRAGRLTSGRGKGEVTRYYAYFLTGEFQNWIEIPEATFAALRKDKAAVLKLERVVAPAPAEAPAAEAPAAAPKGKRAKREAVEA